MNFIKKERMRLGYMAKEVADYTGISLVAQSRYENGKRFPDTKYLYKLAEMGFDMHFVITGERIILKLDNIEELVIAKYRQLNEESKNNILIQLVKEDEGVKSSVSNAIHNTIEKILMQKKGSYK